MSIYTLRFYKGKKLIAEQQFDAADYDADLGSDLSIQIAHDCASIVDEAVSCNEAEAE